MRISIACVAVACAAVGLVIWAAASGAARCPPREHLAVVAWVPVTVGKIVIIQPVYACQPFQAAP